ncbi:MAG TPA: hypothetical protein VGB77_22385 [Abditibacteriaceae bacterium]|jgi:hypothetical protein
MRRFLLCWLLGTQLPALFTLWAAKNIATIAATSNAPGLTVSWPLLAWSGFAVYALLVLGLSATSWFYYRREEDNIAVILTSLLLPVTLPILAYSIVRFFAVR